MKRTLIYLAVLSAATLLRTAPATAAESYDNCTGFITSVPATITTQGVWCMDRDLSTAISSGNAITVATNNVTIDCNHFKLGGLQTGPGTNAYGVGAEGRLNTTIRNCNIRGFIRGASLNLGGGHLIENSRFEGNTRFGIFVQSPGSTIRANYVIDTGGSSVIDYEATGIFAGAGSDVMDNLINGIAPTGANGWAVGILTTGSGGVSGNRIRGLAPKGAGHAYGYFGNPSDQIVIRDNSILGPGGAGTSVGIRCGTGNGIAMSNGVSGFQTGIQNCVSSANVVSPQ